jgi:hypothetical protein
MENYLFYKSPFCIITRLKPLFIHTEEKTAFIIPTINPCKFASYTLAATGCQAHQRLAERICARSPYDTPR